MNVKLITLVSAFALAHVAIAPAGAINSNRANSNAVGNAASINHDPNPTDRTTPLKASVTKAEAQAFGMTRLVENFERIDVNRDGIVTRSELRTYVLASRRYVPMT